MGSTLFHLNTVKEEKQTLQTEMIRAREREERYRSDISEAERKSTEELAIANLRFSDQVEAAKNSRAELTKARSELSLARKIAMDEEAEPQALRVDLMTHRRNWPK